MDSSPMYSKTLAQNYLEEKQQQQKPVSGQKVMTFANVPEALPRDG